MDEQTPLKRQREETQIPDEETKRHKSYNHILSLLESEEDEPNQDLSSLITALQHELSSDTVLDDILALEADQENPRPAIATETADAVTGAADGGIRMIKSRLWELEDEAANYYTLLQSELFL
ncbi:uncharacterized protein LOC120210757 [Hibiscus syriacus]|uniref:uncharacterized protein LOC120210757 n=1 Tax=Hibiscus syriacus TaxID=106335 RepID=UPI001922A9E1|nr:uncharacterized protein LOC120210757 [Hibiscus syriacus]